MDRAAWAKPQQFSTAAPPGAGASRRGSWGLGLAILAVTFLLGRASVLQTIYPFGIAFQAATWNLQIGRIPRYLWGIALMAGTLSQDWSWRGLQGIAAVVLLELLLQRWARVQPSPGRLALLTLAASLSAGSVRAWLGAGDGYRWVSWAFEAGLSALLVFVFRYGVGAFVTPRRFRLPSTEEVLCTGILLAAALAGLAQITIAGFALQTAVGALLVMVFGLVGGAPLGAALGASLGTIAGISTTVSPALVGAFAFSGLLAGIFRDLGRWGAALGFLVGQVMVLYYAETGPGLWAVLREGAVASVALMLLPERELKALAKALWGAARAPGWSVAPEVAVREISARRLQELAAVFQELAGAFEQAAPTTAAADGRPAGTQAAQARDMESMAPIFGEIAERVCRDCKLHRACWEQEFYRTYRTMRELWAQHENGRNPGNHQPLEELRRFCIRSHEMALTVAHFSDLYRLNRYWQRRVNEGRTLVSGQLRGVAQVVERLAGEVQWHQLGDEPARPSLMRRRKPALDFEVGVSRASKPGSLVSGDSYLVRRLEGGRLLAALSDGMGAGTKAALESRATISLLERLMETGFATTVAVQTINSILLLRSPEEHFATMDMALIDLNQGSAEFVKIGAATSYLKRGLQVAAIEASSLPIGILQHIDVETRRRSLRAGDVLVMVSDGLFGQRQGEDGDAWVRQFLAKCPHTNPQVVSEALLAKALEGHRGEVNDDITVLVLRLISTQSGRSQQEMEVSECRPGKNAN